MSDFGTISSLPNIPAPADDGSFARRKARSWRETVATRTSGQSEPKLEMSGEILPPTSGQVDLKSMNFRELDQAIDGELCGVRDRLIPYLVRMREMLSDQGKRTDLPSDIPKKLTWQAWIESKKSVLGSISTVNRMLREAYDEEHKKKACPECGNRKGHANTCSKYVPPEPEPLTALEKKFVGSALQQHETLRDYYAGRTDADAALKALVKALPTHQALEEYTSREGEGSEDEANQKADESNQKLEEQEKYVAQLGSEIARLNAENSILQQRLAELAKGSNHLSDATITADLAAEPDIAVANKLLTDYFGRESNRALPAHMALSALSASVRIAGRNHRIMPGDYLEKRGKDVAPVLCKCTGIAEFMKRRRLKEWSEGKWGKEHVIFSADETDYRVISEEVARRLAPEAFSTPTSPEGL